MKGPFDDFLTLVVADCVNARSYPLAPKRPVLKTVCCGALTGFPNGAYETWCVVCNEQTCTACARIVDNDDEGYAKLTCKECAS